MESKLVEIEQSIIEIRNKQVILDSDVAIHYGVQTKEINQAVKNNPDKFPSGYILNLEKYEWDSLKSNFLTSNKGGKVKTPKAFTEKGLYMLATILKSKQATQTTLEIIETFSKIRALNQNIEKIQAETNKQKQERMLEKTGDIIAELLDDGLTNNKSETSIELNLAVLKIKKTLSKGK